MSWQATRWASSQRVGDRTLKLLLMVIAGLASEDGVCWYKQEVLANDAEMSDRTVRRGIVRLRELGLIVRTEQLKREVGGNGNLRIYLSMVESDARADTQMSGRDEHRADTQMSGRSGHPDVRTVRTPRCPDGADIRSPDIDSSSDPSSEPSSEPSPSVRFADSARSDFSKAHVVDSTDMSFIGWADAFLAALRTAKTVRDVNEFFRLNNETIHKLKRNPKQFDRVIRETNELLRHLSDAEPADAEQERNEESDAGTEPDDDDDLDEAEERVSVSRSAVTSPPRDADALEFERKIRERREAERLAKEEADEDALDDEAFALAARRAEHRERQRLCGPVRASDGAIIR